MLVRNGLTLVITLLLLMLFLLTVPLGRQARLVPMYVVIPTLLLAGIQLFREWRTSISSTQSPQPALPTASQEFLAIGWLLLLALSITILGFWIGVPLYLFSYLKFRARESTRYALVVSLIGYAALKIIFSFLLNIDLYSPDFPTFM